VAIICTVRIPHPLETVQSVERANPEVMSSIITGARQHMVSHRRFASEAEVLDMDEYASREDYDAFMAMAGTAVKQFGALLGDPPVDEVWEVIES
jgi:hypothetical protein